MLKIIINEFLYAFIAVFPLINPIATASAFYNLTYGASSDERKSVAIKVSVYGAILLLCTLIVGPFVLKFFGLQAADIRVAGGLIVFSIAWKMLNSPSDTSRKNQSTVSVSNEDINSLAFYPLTMPLTAGAGSIAIVVALAAQADSAMSRWYDYLAIALAILVIFVSVYFCYFYSDKIFKLLGKNGSKAATALSAFIMLAISISVIWSGIQMLVTPMMK